MHCAPPTLPRHHSDLPRAVPGDTPEPKTLMSDKLKTKLSAIFLPKSTYSAANMSPSSSSPQSQPARLGSTTATATATITTPPAPYRIPVIVNSRDSRQRKQQTMESENARNELLRHGIKVRDFQIEAEARAHNSMAMETTMQAQAQADSGGCSDRMTEAAVEAKATTTTKI